MTEALRRREQPPTDQEQLERDFRSSLEDVVAISRKLIPYCSTFEDFVTMVELGCINDGQLRVLMKVVGEPEPEAPPGGKRG